MAKKRTQKTPIKVTGRSVAYIQTVSKDGKLGKAQPVVVTTVSAGAGMKGIKKSRRKK